MTANKQLQIITEVIREEVRFLIYERKYLKESEFEISKEDLMKSMVDSKGQIFTITFFKRKDGSQRVMNCRYGVRSYLKGGSLPYDPNKKISLKKNLSSSYFKILVE